MERNKEIVKVSAYGIIVNILLVIFKMIIGLISNSIVIILDAVNNLSDVLSSVITIVGTKLSSKKPDKKHPYGHGRIEYFTAVIIAIIIVFAGLVSVEESFIKIIDPVEVKYDYPVLIIVIVAIITKYILGKFFQSKGEKLNSSSLVASGLDALSDAFLSLTILVGIIISLVFSVNLEGYLGMFISLFILKSAFEVLMDTINDMIGTRPDSKLTKGLRNKINSYDKVEGTYDLILHNYGPNNIIGSAHIQVNDNMTAKEINRLTRNITIDIYKKYGIFLTLGIYASNDTGENLEIKNYLIEILKNYKTIIQFHGFYVDEEKKYITFDIIFDFSEKNPDAIRKEIVKTLKAKYSDYDYYVIVDADISD